MIRTILVATDGSDHAKKALTLASDLGAKYGAKMALNRKMPRIIKPK